MATSASSAAAPGQVEVLINPEDKQLKTVAHSLLESKLEKMLSSAAAPVADPRATKKFAIEWIKQWDLDGDGIISELEMKGAAMQHAKLQMSYQRREFLLQRVGYMPFDQLSQITGIGFTYRGALWFMDVEGFQWFGSGNVTFFSPRGVVLSVTRPTETMVVVTVQEPGDIVRTVSRGLEQFLGYEQFVDSGIARLKNMSVPVTVDNMFKYFWEPTVIEWVRGSRLPVECIASGLAWLNGSSTELPHQTCVTALLMFLQGTGVIEGGVGPQDYYGTKMTREEQEELTGPLVYTKGSVFEPDIASFEAKVRRYTQRRIDVMSRAR
eukprot:jgi/Mesvir1/29756/Mv16424-RA.1